MLIPVSSALSQISAYTARPQIHG